MSTDTTTIHVRGFVVEVVRKDIKNLHLGVYPPAGRVRVAAPFAVSDDAVRVAVIGKLGWIRRQRERFEKQDRQSAREVETGESHYVFGRRYLLTVVPSTDRPQVVLRTKTKMDLHVPRRTSRADRALILDQWYRAELRKVAAPLLKEWGSTVGVDLGFWGIKRMKTKWGSCNSESARIWLNSELAKKPVECLEYIIVHELVHLVEPKHGDRFVTLMDKYLPDWRQRRDRLNSSPLAHETWTY